MEEFQEKDILWPESESIQSLQTTNKSNYTNSTLNLSLIGTSTFSSSSDSSGTTAELEQSELSSWPDETGEEEKEDHFDHFFLSFTDRSVEISSFTGDGVWQEADVLFPYESLKDHDFEFEFEWKKKNRENGDDLARKEEGRKVSSPIDIPKRKSNNKTGFMFYQLPSYFDV